MSVLLNGVSALERVTEGRKVLRPAGEPGRPPTRARLVAACGRPVGSGCGPRPVTWRWRWLLALALVAALLVAGLSLFAGRVSGAVPERTATVTVGAGENLWTLAHRYAPGADPDAVVARIRELNRLGGGAVVDGMPLTVPVGGNFSGAGN
ncbi:hypothetical protein ORV05_06435 [Amycolatopsis cynarae]|uniref:LysM peptidoglycan-binding domain-containing protein n=1 Tax=Amycolatopsis cynarae TaxID=2995223 RepID=A0ABY7B9M8_9PSEU|nr:hypothetical protein [Amycolatopsis sp. HUAS 11-8]WAL67418.1 hypothetical protein ORV05_06435 [Amycolatopsis sp. HUAS 11-8]